MKAADLPRHYNAVDVLERNLPQRSRQTALYSVEREMTFQEVADEVNQVGNALKRLGVRSGDFVGILAPDCPEWVTAFFGVVKIGAVAMGLSTLLKPRDYEYFLRDSRARVLIVDESLLPAIEAIRDRPLPLQHVVVIGRAARDGDVEFRPLIQGESKELEAERTHRDDFCTLNYSSGPGGEPKGVLHAHKDYPLVAQLCGAGPYGLRATDRTFSLSKLFFVYGLGGNLIFPWYVGASIVLYSGLPRAVHVVLEIIQRFKPSVLYSVPTAYVSTMALDDFAARYDLSSLRLCFSAGEALPASAWHAWKERTGLEILDTIGCTETLHIFMGNRPGEVRPGSSGKTLPGYDVRLVDEQGTDVPPGEVGHLLVRGETTALFYLHQYELSRRTFRGEWLATGDRYYMDADGFYWFAGRADEMLKVGGLWVSPAEVASALKTHPAVMQCAVVGLRNQAELVKPKAFVRLREGYASSKELTADLRAHCTRELAAYKCPHWFEFVDELPEKTEGQAQSFHPYL